MYIEQKSLRPYLIFWALLIFLLFAQFATAEEKQQYKFNDQGTPNISDDRATIKFKTDDPNEKNDVMADPVNKIENAQPFKTYLDYPRFQLFAAFNPVMTGFKQNYKSLPLNYGSNSYTSALLAGKMIFSPYFSAELEYGHQAYSVTTKSLGSFGTINQSTANIDTVTARVNYCQVYDHPNNKLCYTGIGGLDAYPSLDFKDSTNIQLTAIKDFVIGVGIGYQHVLLANSSYLAGIEYISGLKMGQNSSLGVDADTKIKAKFNVDFYNQKNLDYSTIGIAYEYRDAKVHGSTGSFIDIWTTQATSFSVLAGYTWTFGD